MKNKTQTVIEALKVLGWNGDVVFERIRGCLERGDVRGARAHLNFVDKLLEDERACVIASKHQPHEKTN